MTFSNFYHSTKSTRTAKHLARLVGTISAREAKLQALSMSSLQREAKELRDLAAGRKGDEAWLGHLFAVVRESSRRVLGLRQHDVQLIGGLVLSQGKLAEMRTGEGKTLSIAAPCVAAAFEGYPVHVITVNEYLAQRDAETLRPLFEAMGLTVGVIRSSQTVAEKRAAYCCDVVYGVNHEFGFDYLRDNMAQDASSRVQRGLGFAVVDEVDSILIDEARTPLIISGLAPSTDGVEAVLNAAVLQLSRSVDYVVDEKEHVTTLTDAGYSTLEKLLVKSQLIASPQAMYQVENLGLLQLVGQSLVAHSLYRRDKHYVVQDGEVLIIDGATGRLMKGRRWGEGLHEAVEAKEGVDVKPRTVTQASITYQNFFGLYDKLCGLTGTASTEAEEFVEIYGLATVVVPPNKPVVREDLTDVVYLTSAGKFSALVAEVAVRHATGQPVLVGTGSVADSERVSALLKARAVPHLVLNARQNEQEADVIARAGLPGAVTVATNMAGRGTDIILGGYREAADAPGEWETRRTSVLDAGGLFVIGSERHESRRIDNQLRGRAGRQGDIGASQFFVSLEDKLLRVFAAERQGALAKVVGADGGVSNPLLDKAITMAQKRIEEQGFQARRDLMKYDQVLASQRLALYRVRNEFLFADRASLISICVELAEVAADGVSREWLAQDWIPENFDVLAFKATLMQTFGVVAPVVGWAHTENLEPSQIRQKVRTLVGTRVAAWAELRTEQDIRTILLSTLDLQWIDHLTGLDELRAAIGLRALAQQNPVFAFALEAKRLFAEIQPAWAFALTEKFKEQAALASAIGGDPEAQARLSGDQKVELALFQRWVTRTEACPCGSGEKFKFCHGL